MSLSLRWVAGGRRPGRFYRLFETPHGGDEPVFCGVTVRHCGHPTALFPYYIAIDGEEAMVLDHNGRGFGLLRDAKARAEEMLRDGTVGTQSQ